MPVQIRKIRWWAAFISVLLLSPSYAGPFVIVESSVLSEPEPIKASIEDWGEGFGAGERQWVVSNAEIGVRYEGFEVSVQQRALADFRFNPEAATFFGELSRKDPLTPGQIVPVDIRVNGFTAQALRLGYRHQARTWTIGASAARLRASHLMSGSLEGRFAATSTQDYDFDAAVDYYYYRDPLFDRAYIREPEGDGWSFRVLGAWQPNDYMRLSAEVDDLFASIRWDEAPFTQAQAHTNRKRYDEEGYAVFDPLLAGTEGYADSYEQELDPRYQLNAQVGLGVWAAHLQARHQFGFSYAGFGVGARSGDFEWKALAWPQLDAAGFELGWRDLLFGLTLDALSPDELQFVNFTLAYGY